jgi:nitronate monooxygenase
MAKAWNHTRGATGLSIEYPIIEGPLGGLSSQRLAATVSNFGGLGSFGTHGFEPHAIRDLIAEIRTLTSKPSAESPHPISRAVGTIPALYEETAHSPDSEFV